MNIKNRLFPYPVLCGETDDYLDSANFVLESDITETAHELLLKYDYIVHCNSLETVIRKGEAEYVLHVECSTTSFRIALKSTVPHIEYRLPKARVNGEINLVAMIQRHSKDPKYIELGEKLEKLRDQHKQGLIGSIEFLKMLLALAREAARAERTVVPEEEIDRGKAALTELFNGVRNDKTPIIVERIVNDIDGIVKIVRFDGWQNTTEGQKEVKKALRSIIWIKYKLKNQDVFDRAYSYIEQYY